MKRPFAQYEVGLKILPRRGTEFLFLRAATRAGRIFDYAGGRIDAVEHAVPLQEILRREVTEELGPDFRYEVGPVAFQFRRTHCDPDDGGWVFLTVFEAEYMGGEIVLSEEHTEYRWIDPDKEPLTRAEFFTEEEYLAITEYFARRKEQRG
ncbi:MAG: NUDIX hydrolase [bacterium]|nr:NUDIX hydrolase [bacterium]